MTTFVVGGESIEVSLLNWKQQKAVWPLIEAATMEPNYVKSVDAILAIVSAAGTPKYTTDQLDEKLTPAESIKLPQAVGALMVEIGLQKPKDETAGEAKPEEGAASPSTATSTD